MRWYTAHVITYIRYKAQRQETFPVYENLVLIAATSTQEAVQKAADKARLEYVGDSEGTLTSDGEPAEMVFAGVRKVVLVDDSDERPGDGTELSYTEMQVSSIEDIERLAAGQTLPVRLDAVVDQRHDPRSGPSK